MNLRLSPQRPSRPPVVLTLAHLLDRLERGSPRIDAAQYRSVVLHLEQELASVKPGQMLDAVLDSYPSAAELYENLHYGHAGLCRSDLEFSLGAEKSARHLIHKIRQAANPMNPGTFSGEE